MNPHAFMRLAVAILLSTAAGCAAVAFPSQDSSSAGLLNVSPVEINLPEVRSRFSETSFTITNHTPAIVEIASIETSCECLSIELPQRRIRPAEKVQARVRFEKSQESTFSGNLAVEVVGRTATGQLGFQLVVNVSVPSAS